MMLSSLKIPKELRHKIENELEAGESIRWVEQPIPRFFTASSIIVTLFAIPWTSFALFWTWGALGFELPNLRNGLQPQYLFAMFGLPFILIGLFLLTTPFWEWLAARKTVYLVTDRRVITIEGVSFATIRSYVPSELGHIYRKERPDGTGDVIIIKRQWKDSDGDLMSEEIGFTGVRNPRESERYLKQLAQKAI